MERRKFIRTCCNSAVGVPIAASLLSSCRGIHYASATTASDGATLLVARSEFVEIRNGEERVRRFVMINSDFSPFPICLYRQGEGRFTAALMSCTHNVCELSVAGPLYVCPCHGSEFSIDGRVLKGPAEENLLTYKTSIQDEFIRIEKV
jgi:cytochrome b6-f complex iron-sulfur subunit